MFGLTSSSSARNLNGTSRDSTRAPVVSSVWAFGPFTRKPSSSRSSACWSGATTSIRFCRRASVAVTFTASRTMLRREVAVAAVSLRERAHVRRGVVADLAAQHLVLLAAAERDRRRRADVRLRRHRRDVGGLGDVQARGCGARAVRRHVDHHRHRRGEDVLHDVPGRVVQAAGRVEPEDDDVGVRVLGVVERLVDPGRGGRVDRQVEGDRLDERALPSLLVLAGRRAPPAAQRPPPRLRARSMRMTCGLSPGALAGGRRSRTRARRPPAPPPRRSRPASCRQLALAVVERRDREVRAQARAARRCRCRGRRSSGRGPGSPSGTSAPARCASSESTARNATCLPRFVTCFWKKGNSNRHGPHHEAHLFTTTG